MRKPLIAGNWKMYKDHREAMDLVNALWEMIGTVEGVEVAVCPPFTSLPAVSRLIEEKSMRLILGAQDAFYEREGAFTGEISVPMLKALGVDLVIVGHSERRQILKEDDQLVSRKLQAILSEGLRAILCCGETLEERKRERAFSKVQEQLDLDLQALRTSEAEGLIVAYEPIWAIGTGVNATPEDAQEMIYFIRERLALRWGEGVAQQIRILYGGSVKPDNASSLLTMQDIDGALVGGASLKAADFAEIVKAAAV